ncbi:hypothetical protein BZG36_01596, partial [Bifiguratus adelaidae]
MSDHLADLTRSSKHKRFADKDGIKLETKRHRRSSVVTEWLVEGAQTETIVTQPTKRRMSLRSHPKPTIIYSPAPIMDDDLPSPSQPTISPALLAHIHTLQTLLDCADETFFILNRDMTSLIWLESTTFDNVFGWDRSLELKENPFNWMQWIHPEDLHSIQHAACAVRDIKINDLNGPVKTAKRRLNLQYRIIRPDGSIRRVSTAFRPLVYPSTQLDDASHVPSEELTGLHLWIHRDVTDSSMEHTTRATPPNKASHREESQVFPASKAIPSTSIATPPTTPPCQALTHIAHASTHDYLTPLNGILGMANLLLATDLTEEQRDYTHIIQNDFLGSSSSTLGHPGLRLGTHDTTTPGAAVFFVLVVEVGLDGGNDGGKSLLVLGLDISESNGGSSLLANDGSKTSLALDNAVWHTHLTAKSGKPDHNFNGVNIVSNNNQRSLLGLNEGSDDASDIARVGLLHVGKTPSTTQLSPVRADSMKYEKKKSAWHVRQGHMQVTVLKVLLNHPIKHPYVRISLGDQSFQTTASNLSTGHWFEGFQLKVSYHAQLFDTIQLDIYDASNIILIPDTFVGRAEIRLKTLEGVPEVFNNYYEIWDKKTTPSNSSEIRRRKLLASNIGAIQLRIQYRWQILDSLPSPSLTSSDSIFPVQTSSDGYADTAESSAGTDGMKDLTPYLRTSNVARSLTEGSATSRGDVSPNNDTDDAIAKEFERKLQDEREGNAASVGFNKIEEESVDLPNEDLAQSERPSFDSDQDSLLLDGFTNDTLVLSSTYEITRSISTLNQSSFEDSQTTKEKPDSRTKSWGSSIGSYISRYSFFGSSASSEKTPIITRTASSRNMPTDDVPADDEPPATAVQNLEKNYFSIDLGEDQEPSSFIGRLGSWAVTKETNRVLKNIMSLLAAFGQGFEYSNLQVLAGFTVLEKFYNDLQRPRIGSLVTKLEDIELASHLWKFAMAAYGWRGINFIGKGNGIIADAIRAHSDVASVIEFLSIPKDDLLAYEFHAGAVLRPSYFIARDRTTNSLVLSIRGTMSAFDTLTDLSAQWFFTHVVPQLITYANNHSPTALYIVGHSMGAGAAAILTIMLQDYLHEFMKGRESSKTFVVKCVGFAPACGLSLDLSERYQDIIESFVFGDDVVSKLSYGSMMDLKDLVIASADAAQSLGLAKVFWTGKPNGP